MVDMVMVWVVSAFVFYFMLTLIFFILFRKVFVEAWRNFFWVKRGYGYVRINGADKRVREYFVNIKKPVVSINKKTYILDPAKIKFKGKAGLYEFMENISEPLDLYATKLIGTDSEFLDALALKLKALGSLKGEDKLKLILYICAGAAIAGVAAAIIAYTNYNSLNDLTKFLIK